MKRKYKLLIVAAVSVVLLLCSVVSVGAASFTETYIRSATNITSISFVSIENSTVGLGRIVESGVSPEGTLSFNMQNTGADSLVQYVQIDIIPESGFLADLNFYEDFTIGFSIGQRPGFSDSSSSFRSVAVYLYDSTGNSVYNYAFSPDVTASDMQWTNVVFDSESMQGFCDITKIRVVINYQDWLDSLIGVAFRPYVVFTYTDRTADYITEGWTPNPETPDNAQDVSELGSIEEQLQSGSEEGINAGMDMITGLGSSLAGFQKGFVFLIDLFDELTGEIKWISSVLTIGLALGIVAFLLNIVGSVASKISRDERRAEADKRRAEADARREKRQHKR